MEMERAELDLSRPGSLKTIPYNILVYLLSSFCDCVDVLAFERCSKFARHIASDEIIWKKWVTEVVVCAVNQKENRHGRRCTKNWVSCNLIFGTQFDPSLQISELFIVDIEPKNNTRLLVGDTTQTQFTMEIGMERIKRWI
jgi:hypothetical protein